MTATSMAGRWQLIMQTPAGEKMPVLNLIDQGDGHYTGSLEQPGRDTATVREGRLEGQRLRFKADGRLILPVTFNFDLIVQGDQFSGTVKLGILPATQVHGQRLNRN